jgi:hypothetical protein
MDVTVLNNVIQRYLLDVNIALLAFRVIRRQVHVSMNQDTLKSRNSAIQMMIALYRRLATWAFAKTHVSCKAFVHETPSVK